MAYQLPDNVMQSPHVAVRQIMEQVKLRQSGAMVASMKRMGLNYNLNYGVSRVHLKEIVSTYQADNALAFLLFQFDIREAKLLAALLFIPEDLTREQLHEIANGVSTGELVEQYALHVFSRLKKPLALFDELLGSGGYGNALGLASLAWAIKKHDNMAAEGLKRLTELQDVNAQNQQFVSLLMNAIANTSEDNKQSVRVLANKFEKSSKNGFKEIGQDFIWLHT